MSGFSIGGIASGLDTSSIIEQLMALERRPLQVMADRQTTWKKVDAAWGQVNTKLSTIRSAVDALRDPAALRDAVAVTSSNSDVATAKLTGRPRVGVTDLNVDALASAHRAAVGGSFSSASDAVGAGTITVRGADGTTALGTVELTETTTLEEAARRFEAVDGIRAQIVDSGAGGHRLVLTAEGTGADGAFTVEAPVGHRFETSDVLNQGTNAQLSMGSMTITRSSNTITDLIDGVELRLSGTGAVSVAVDQDVDASAKLVEDLVTAVNGALTDFKKLGNTSATAAERGVLAGDATLRSLTTQLRGVVAELSIGGDYGTPSTVGISLTRDGQLELDGAKLRAAIQDDPAAVAALVGRASSASDPGVEITATGGAAAGTYRLQVDVAATVASVTGADYTPPTTGPKTFAITTASGREVQVTLTTDDTSLASAVTRINDALRAAGDTSVSASADGNAIRLAATRAGTSGDFTVTGSGDLGLDAVTGGTGASGRLIAEDGTEYAVSSGGQTLAGPAGTPLSGLVLRVPLDATGDRGTVTVADGLAGEFDRVLRTAEGATGSIATARESLQSRIRSTDDSIAAATRRLTLRETTLRKQFTAMEAALATLHSQGNWLASQLGSA